MPPTERDESHPTASGWRHRDHTRGGLLASLLVLALPPVGTSLAGAVVFQLVDLKFIAALGTASMAGVIVANQSLRQVSFLLVMGLSFGAQTLVSHAVGSGRAGEASRVAGQVLLLGASLALLLALVGGTFPRELLGLVDPAPPVLEAGIPYVRLTFLLSFGFIGVAVFGAILTGAGDATTPMVISVLVTPIAIFAEWCLIFGNLGAPALGVSGVALGIACGNIPMMGVALWALFRGRCRIHVRWRDLRADPPLARRLLRLSWQPAIQLMSRTLLVFYFIWLSARFGTEVQAAYAIGLRLELVPMALAFPIANACATLVGQNLGAGRPDRARRAVGIALAVHAGLLWTVAAVLVAWRQEIVTLFSQEPEVVRVGSEYLLYSAASFVLYGVYFVAFRSLQGAGEVTAPMLISAGSAAIVGGPLAWWLATRTPWGPTGIWIAGLATTASSTLLTVGWFVRRSWARGVPDPRDGARAAPAGPADPE